MKTRFLILILSSMIQLAGLCAYAGSSDLAIEPDVSILLLSPDFAHQVAEQTAKVALDGEQLKIMSISTLVIGDHRIVNVNLQKGSSCVGWKPYGDITGMIVENPSGVSILEAVYFSPNVEPPGGGATVGN